MPARKSLAEQLSEAANPEPKDYDPEDLEYGNQNSGTDSEPSEDEDRTSHYVAVGRSKFRDDGIALSEGKYKGSRVSRKDLDDASDDSSEAKYESGSESAEESDATTSEVEPEGPAVIPTAKASSGISQILSDEQKHLLSRLSNDKENDVAKGKAVQAQMRVYENLLDIRIQTQKLLNSTNKSTNREPCKSDALFPLLSKVSTLRRELNGKNEVDQDFSSLAEYAADAEKLDLALAAKRDSVLTKWSRKVELSSGKNALQSNRFKSFGQSAALQVSSVLGDMERLVKRTQVDRSNYGVDAAQAWLFDDTDFYRLLLKELVDRRMADSSASSGLKWKAAAAVTKQKKKVDTKASKGRKLRYNVMEKIQGFDAPRDVFTWSDKQAEDLYSGLLGVKISMDDDLEPEHMLQDAESSNDVKITEDFNLFG